MMTLDKNIISIKSDNTYTVLEFDDGTLMPYINIQPVDMIKRCIFCHKHEKEIHLGTLDNHHYICTNCATSLIELFVKSGVTIDFNITDIAPKIAKSLEQFFTENNISSIANTETIKK